MEIEAFGWLVIKRNPRCTDPMHLAAAERLDITCVGAHWRLGWNTCNAALLPGHTVGI
jgi:hypothetical protein